MEEKIWYELLHTKFGDCYLNVYLESQKSIKKWVKIATLLFSSSGIMGWAFWKDAPIVSCIVITIIQLFNLVQKQIILSDIEIAHIANLKGLFFSHFNKVEKLWVDYRAGRITEEAASESFYKLRKEYVKIEKLDTKLNVKERDYLKKRAKKHIDAYISQYHNN
ncbi:hypothetical protein SAMN05216490_3479 [Mucilaginibacter mallensis]|uniref:SMODS and SLOG-associating 2TM effector domain-containing protein n=1 Tax=Mucilaginibacter mallensis TaxID=652787 RepID=A0A1H2ACV0_MUCMA|nr:hypothetical protein [Mucilaginibacter mallensis]SDT43790.1 hypothetical protein SAMN05216490_3479 [Mucilaginibacter mallensis]